MRVISSLSNGGAVAFSWSRGRFVGGIGVVYETKIPRACGPAGFPMGCVRMGLVALLDLFDALEVLGVV